ncbi:MAG: o-succinylbenzoate--CoA ligase [Deltaproteobacteria bacterium]|nr:o-succinylbenzoate--CoA ligase [Deltaproteobacteria bacterium]
MVKLDGKVDMAVGAGSGIGSWLTKRQLLTPAEEAVVDGEKHLTYCQLNQRVNRLAHGLQALGVQSGDRISILAYNCSEFVEVIMAAAKLGAILVPLNWRLTPAELSYILNDSVAHMLFFHPELATLAQGVKETSPIRRWILLDVQDMHPDMPSDMPAAESYESLLQDRSEEELRLDPAPDLDTPHIIMYTAGTTGRPKGAVLSQGASFWNAVNLTLAMDFTSEDRNLAILPMFHIGGIGLFTLPMLYQGGTVVIQRTFEPAQTLKLLRKERITLFFGVPSTFLSLIQHPEFKAEVFERVRVVMSGGAPLPVSLIYRYQEAGIILQQGFGMSEAAPSIATLSRDLAIQKAGSIGKALKHVEARVVDDQMMNVPQDHVGELVIRGPNLMQGYWNKPEATKEVFSGGWFHTGDLARMDPEGDLTIVERKKDMFISGGENVYPAEVENAVYELPEVAEAAVIGIRDERWGEVGKAVVVLKEGKQLKQEDIIFHLKGRLAKYKIPKGVVFTEVLPRNAAGKVLKTQLRDTLG